jgi:hypothetical protein
MEVDSSTEAQQCQQHSNGVAGLPGGQGQNTGSSCSSWGAEVSSTAVAAAQLPHPYQGLPPSGVGAMVATLLPAMLPGCLKELGEWTSRARVIAAR